MLQGLLLGMYMGTKRGKTGDQVIDYCCSIYIYDVCKELQRTYVNMPRR